MVQTSTHHYYMQNYLHYPGLLPDYRLVYQEFYLLNVIEFKDNQVFLPL